MSGQGEHPVALIVMGVQGTGKTTLGTLLAQRLGVPFIDGDKLHPPRNIERMAAGQPLTDADRQPWLHRVGETLAASLHEGGAVIACSALKRAYRDTLREHVSQAFFVEPHGPIELVAERIKSRDHDYMPHTLLQSQYDTLEPLAPDERGLRIGIELSPEDIVHDVIADYTQTVGELA